MKVLGAKRRHWENDNNNIIPLETGNNDCMDFDLQKRGDKTDIVDHDLDTSSSPPSLERIVKYANSYNCEMSLYGNNCRMFAARMEREVERINMMYGGNDDGNINGTAINLRCSLRILGAALLPALYPLGALLLLYEGYWIA